MLLGKSAYTACKDIDWNFSSYGLTQSCFGVNLLIVFWQKKWIFYAVYERDAFWRETFIDSSY